MAFLEPFMLGPFSVDVDGGLTPARRDVPAGFSIRWHGRAVHARLVQDKDQEGHLSIQSSLGRIRAACLTMLQKLLNALPEGWKVRLLPDHQPRLEVETDVALPITVYNLVTEMTLFLLTLSPYLDLMDEAGVGLIPGAA